MKRRQLSVNITPAAHEALMKRAAAEGHRYPSVLAASILERALLGVGVDGASRGGGGHADRLQAMRQIHVDAVTPLLPAGVTMTYDSPDEDSR